MNALVCDQALDVGGHRLRLRTVVGAPPERNLASGGRRLEHVDRQHRGGRAYNELGAAVRSRQHNHARPRRLERVDRLLAGATQAPERLRGIARNGGGLTANGSSEARKREIELLRVVDQ